MLLGGNGQRVNDYKNKKRAKVNSDKKKDHGTVIVKFDPLDITRRELFYFTGCFMDK